MTVPPLPLLLFSVALVGWPSLKLAATLIARPIWREQRELRDRLLSQHELEPRFKRLAEEMYIEGKGSALQLVLPVVVFSAELPPLSQAANRNISTSRISTNAFSSSENLS